MNFHFFFFRVLLLCFLTNFVGATPDGRSPIPFQVFLWPGAPNPNLDAKLREGVKEKGSRSMLEYVPPTIEFSPNGGDEVELVQAAEQRLSPTYWYEGSNPLVFFRQESVGTGSVRRVFLGDVSIPPSFRHALLLFLPDPESRNTYRIYPIDNSRERVKPGEACVLNITGTTIGCLFNQEQILLEPGEQKVVPIGASESVYIVVRIGAENNKGDWKERYAEQLYVNPSDSLTILVYNKAGRPNNFRIMQIKNPGSGPVSKEKGLSHGAKPE